MGLRIWLHLEFGKNLNLEASGMQNIEPHAKLILTDGTFCGIEPHDGKKFSIDELRVYIGGGFPQLFCPISNLKAALIVDEQGKRTGLPLNPLASQIMRHSVYGNVVLCLESQLWMAAD